MVGADEKSNPSQVPPISLQSIAIQIMVLSELITEAQGEVTAEVETAMNYLSQQLENTTDLHAFLIERLEVEAEFQRNKARVHTAKARRTEAALERVKSRVKAIMLDLKSKRLTGRRSGFLLKKSKDKVVIDETKFPSVAARPDLYKEKKEYVVDKQAVLDCLVKGETIRGACLEEVYALTPIDVVPTIEIKNGSGIEERKTHDNY